MKAIKAAGSNKQAFGVNLLAASSGIALFAAAFGAHAQAAPPAPAALGEVVVTASRITTAGFSAPTPTEVISTQAIQQAAQPNIFNTIAALPALQGSTGVANTTQNGNTSIGSNGLSALNMRGLGSIRTLTLLDGQRVVGAYITGVADVSQFPQLLVQRVDVVTGGASASWGSDAISGVVNFVTDKHFEGFKSNFQYGQSTYGDAQGATVQVALGPLLPAEPTACRGQWRILQRHRRWGRVLWWWRAPRPS